MQYDVFISYRREGGLDLARQLAQQLERLGVSCFFDLEEIQTGKFNEKIYEAIDNSRYFIFILSPRSLDRCANDGDWVRQELEYAFSRQLLPILVLWKGNQPEYPVGIPESLKELKNIQVSFIDRDTAFGATVRQLIEERLPGVETNRDRKRREAEETFLRRARRFKSNDGIIDEKEKEQLVALAEDTGIDRITRERLIEQVECEVEEQRRSESLKQNSQEAKTSQNEMSASDWFWAIVALVLIGLVGWGGWLLIAWVWNNFGTVMHWAWVVLKWILYISGVLFVLAWLFGSSDKKK